MSFDLVFFGGTGDLVWRKLMPALFQAFRHGTLPEGGRIIGVARDSMSDEQYQTLIQSRFEQVEGAKRPNDEEFARFKAMLHYERVDLSNPADYVKLAAVWPNAKPTRGDVLATAPSLFNTVCEQLGAAQLNTPKLGSFRKATGHDLKSTRPSTRACARCLKNTNFSESTITWANLLYKIFCHALWQCLV